MPWVALASAALGAVSEQKKQDEQRRQAAINMRYGPWSGVGKENTAIQGNGAFQGAIQGGAAGMAYNQNAQNSQAWRDSLKNGQGNPAGNTMPTSSSGWENAPSQNLNSEIYGSNWGNQYGKYGKFGS